MAKIKYGIIAAVVITGAATSLLILQQSREKLIEQDESMRQQSHRLGQLTGENERLSVIAGRVIGSRNQLKDLSRLRVEAESLRRQTNELALLRADNRRLKQMLIGTPKTSLQSREQTMAKVEFEKSWMLAFRLYAMKHQDQFPTSFEQAAPFFPTEAKVEAGVDADQFEVFKQPSTVTLTNVNIIVLREKEPSLDSAGKWRRVYGMVDGSVQTITVPLSYTDPKGQRVWYDSFEAWENEHTITSSGQ